MINIEEFNKIKMNRVTNIYAKKILQLSIYSLNVKSIEALNAKLNNDNIVLEPEYPKVSEQFNDINTYYKDIYKQLSYYLEGYKYDSIDKICKIILNEDFRVLWLNFIKLLLLNLSEKDLEKTYIKLIFYFIVTLFSPGLNYETSLVFMEDVIPILLSQCPISNTLMDNQYLFQILDKDYSQYYSNSDEEIKFNQKVINSTNEKLLKKIKR